MKDISLHTLKFDHEPKQYQINSTLQLVFQACPVSTTNKQIIYGNIKKIQQ